MAITKRVRFEVLRRDNHTCQYCGEKAPDVVLNIDHVVPVALGGDDKPGNLVTACKDCNSGKTSIQPDSPLVQGLSAEAAAYALGMVDKMTRFRAEFEQLGDYTAKFYELWDRWTTWNGEAFPLPEDHASSLFRWMRMGIPIQVLGLAIPAAMSKKHIRADGKFAYMAGVVWNMVNDREIDYTVTEDTAAVFTLAEARDRFEAWHKNGFDEGYDAGFSDGQTFEKSRADIVSAHIDGVHDTGIYAVMSDERYVPWMQERPKDGA